MNTPLEILLTPAKPALVDRPDARFQMLARLRALESSNASRTPLSLVIVIDRSGSMAEDKIAAAKRCTIDLIARMSDDDEIGIVIYDHEVSTLLPLSAVASVRSQAAQLMNRFDSRGNTDLHGGWLAGAELLAPRAGSQRMCRVVLLSDGEANHGLTNVGQICLQVAQLAKAGVTTSTVGIGLGFNEELMSAMAVAGQGTAMFGERPEDLVDPFDAEIGLLSQLAAREVSFEMRSSVCDLREWKMHNEYAAQGEGVWRMPAIAMNSEGWVALSAPMRMLIDAQKNVDAPLLEFAVSLRDSNGTRHRLTHTLPALPIVTSEVYDGMVEDSTVQRRFEEIAAADLQMRAREAVNRGDWDEAEKLVEVLEGVGAKNAWLRSVVEELKQMMKMRDQGRLAKELRYGAVHMRARLMQSFEPDSVEHEALATPFLRRKSVQGRRSDIK
ncbi:MAG: VWA domain-containing protein [Chloroflexi bacterium]|nr:VWA domain-containing protein [Chloroflexota bacterium]